MKTPRIRNKKSVAPYSIPNEPISPVSVIKKSRIKYSLQVVTLENYMNSQKEDFVPSPVAPPGVYDFGGLPPPAYPTPGPYLDAAPHPDLYYHPHPLPHPHPGQTPYYPLTDYDPTLTPGSLNPAGRHYPIMSDYPAGAVTPTSTHHPEYGVDPTNNNNNTNCSSPDSSFYYFSRGGNSNSGYLAHHNNHGQNHMHPGTPTGLDSHFHGTRWLHINDSLPL